MFTINRTGERSFGSDGCQVPIGNSVCGETKTLDIINEFKKLYEEKMQEIDNTSCGDCLQEKIKLQQDWIGDLTEQNEMLVRAVEELEQEATERVRMLEEKLQRSAECICEVMKKYREYDVADSLLEEPRKRIFNLENDMKNLLELLRRIRRDKDWSLEGLTFYDVTKKDLFEENTEEEILSDATNGYLETDAIKAEKRSKSQDGTIKNLETKVRELDEISRELLTKKKECESLQKSMIDMRQALTEEVAMKHDAVLKLKRECQELEERCIQADKQTAFRDDIIKELRKEIKQIKQQENQVLKEDLAKLTAKKVTLESELEMIKYEIEMSLEHVEQQMNEAVETSQGINHNKLLGQLNSLNRSSVKNNLYSFMENEIIQLNKLIDITRNQLQELFNLNKILIRKLFNVGVGLQFLEERADSAQINNLEEGKRAVEFKNCTMKKEKENAENAKSLVEEQLSETKQQIQNLEHDFNNFLIERQKLKEKYKTTAEQGAAIAEECAKLNLENNTLKEQTAKLRIELEKCACDKSGLENKMDMLSKEVQKCSVCCTCQEITCTCQKCMCGLFTNSEKLKEDLVALNEENRSLVQTIVNQRHKIDIRSCVTQEEVVKLNKTIEELSDTLEKTKALREEEEKDKCSQLCNLNNKIKELECLLCEANESRKAREHEISTLNKKIKDLESCLCNVNEKVTVKDANICNLNLKLKDLEQCVCDNEKTKAKDADVLTMKNRLQDLEMCLCEKTEDKDSEVFGLHKRIKDLEFCLCKANENINEKCNEISTLKDTIKDLDCWLGDANEKTKEKCSEIIILSETIRDLENCLCNSNEKTKKYCEEIDTLTEKLKNAKGGIPLSSYSEDKNEIMFLKDRIKELENYIGDLKSKMKLCKYCKHSMKVFFCDNTEVQTDASDLNDCQTEKLIRRDELIKFQAETLTMFQQELCSLQEREKEFLDDKERCVDDCDKIQCLENEIVLLTKKLNTAENKVQDLEETARSKEELIKTQKEALNDIEKQLDGVKSKNSEMRIEHEHQCLHIQQLKCRISELESASQVAERRASNLQMAVDLYTNTINVLEASEEKYKIEIDHQRSTISNLQEALVATKNELDSLKQKCDDSVNDQQEVLNSFLQIVSENELEKENLKAQIILISDKYEKLQDLNFNVEVDHCNSLQDIEGLDHQLFKYQILLKNSEDELKQCKCHLKKLLKQRKSFEEVIQYFKQEMSVMSEQLENLQELLTVSSDSAHEEAARLMTAFVNVQELNQKLTMQLSAAEQTALLENQMNQLNETKINELEKIVSVKDLDLEKHNKTIEKIKEHMAYSIEQNETLQNTISSLSETILEFQEAIRNYENDNVKTKEITCICQSQIESCKEKLTDLKDLLDKKTSELCKIEMAYNNQYRSLKCCQRELREIKERQKNKQYYMKCVIEELKDKLTQTEKEYATNVGDLNELQNQLYDLKKKDITKDGEINRYKRIIGDLKKTLTDLNKTLTMKEMSLQSKCNTEECRKYIEQFNKSIGSFDVNDDNEDNNDDDNEIYCISCPCEGDFYQTMVENVKKGLTDLRAKLFDSQKKNKDLERELREKDLQVQEISRTQLEKDKEYNELKQKLMNRLKAAQTEEARYSERSRQFERELGNLKRELELKTLQLNELERSSKELNGSACVQLACAQEEIGVLKEQLNKLLGQHCIINVENERLHSQSAKMQSTVSSCEEKSQLLKSQVEKYLLELQMMQKEKDALHVRNQDLLHQLRSVQTSYDAVCGQQRYNEETVKSLETELNEVKKNRNDICSESKTVVEYFRLWLQEQKQINEFTINKEKEYCRTIEMLKQQNQNIYQLRETQATCQSPWSLGSQGSSSLADESPSRSPIPCVSESCDWYASNFRNDSEDEDIEDQDWVTKVENLAAEVRKTNKMWKHKMENADFVVSKDNKK